LGGLYLREEIEPRSCIAKEDERLSRQVPSKPKQTPPRDSHSPARQETSETVHDQMSGSIFQPVKLSHERVSDDKEAADPLSYIEPTHDQRSCFEDMPDQNVHDKMSGKISQTDKLSCNVEPPNQHAHDNLSGHTSGSACNQTDAETILERFNKALETCSTLNALEICRLNAQPALDCLNAHDLDRAAQAYLEHETRITRQDEVRYGSSSASSAAPNRIPPRSKRSREEPQIRRWKAQYRPYKRKLSNKYRLLSQANRTQTNEDSDTENEANP
jgi:hypothetical protein